MIARLKEGPPFRGIDSARTGDDGIHSMNFVASLQEMPNEMATDESGRARDQNLSHITSNSLRG
jgi:hypothetical protein